MCSWLFRFDANKPDVNVWISLLVDILFIGISVFVVVLGVVFSVVFVMVVNCSVGVVLVVAVVCFVVVVSGMYTFKKLYQYLT